ncbi:hypothetical protein F4604DRAFT_1676169 [Suillus subluteus]|nr:hypothetical protein F4604DRAFT_1676169 [Suillus subluteus]
MLVLYLGKSVGEVRRRGRWRRWMLGGCTNLKMTGGIDTLAACLVIGAPLGEAPARTLSVDTVRIVADEGSHWKPKLRLLGINASMLNDSKLLVLQKYSSRQQTPPPYNSINKHY